MKLIVQAKDENKNATSLGEPSKFKWCCELSHAGRSRKKLIVWQKSEFQENYSKIELLVYAKLRILHLSQKNSESFRKFYVANKLCQESWICSE